MAGRKILVVGGTGFVGGRLTALLLEDGHELAVMGRGGPARPEARGARPGESVQADLTDRACTERARDLLDRVEKVVYLASATPYSTKPFDDLTGNVMTNIIGAYNFMGMLSRAPQKPRAICYASTVDVYGRVLRIPIDETHVTRPVSNYAFTKLAAERLFSEYCARNKIDLAILRFTHIYGPGDNSPKLVPSTVKALIAGKRPKIYGDGSDLRDMLFVDDAALYLKHWVDTEIAGVFNVATGTSMSILGIAEEIMRLFGAGGGPLFAARIKERIDYVFDTSLLNKRLVSRPPLDLSEGLRRTAAWHRVNAKGPGA